MGERKHGGRETTPPPVTLDDIAEDTILTYENVLIVAEQMVRPAIDAYMEERRARREKLDE